MWQSKASLRCLYCQFHLHDHDDRDARVFREHDPPHLHAYEGDCAPYCGNEHDRGSDRGYVREQICHAHHRDCVHRDHDGLLH